MRKTPHGLRAALIGGLAVVAAASLVACTSAATPNAPTPTAAGAPGADVLEGKGEVDITFWHAMSGTNGDALTSLVDQFNQQNTGKIKVTLAYKGAYDTALAAYKTATGDQRPDLMQMYDIGTRYMIDSKTIVPIQSFVDVDKYDVSDIQPNIAGYYTVDNKLYSMPFNTSMPLLYINREAFQKAGLDPDKPPTTLDEIRAAAEKIKATPGETVQYGFGATLYGWFVEQWNAVANQTTCDADNGRTGRVSAPTLTNPTNTALFAWWQKMVNDGLAMKLDSNTTNGQNAFGSGTVAMGLESTGVLSGYIKNSAQAASPFTVSTGFFPKVSASDTGGPIIGGASLWVVQKPDLAKERAAWELVKFLASKQSQVTWHTATGYFPISKGALTDPTDQAWVSQKPQFSTAIKQLEQTKLTYATQGCSVGVMPDIRKDLENALQAAVLQGQDVNQALSAAQDTASKQISDYNAKLG